MSYLFILFCILFLFFSLVILIPCLFLFHDCFYFLFILFHDKDKRKINDDKRDETGQIQYQSHIGHLPYRLLHVMVA